MEGVLKPKRTKHEGEIGSENASPDFDFIKTKNSEKAKSIVDNCVSDIQLNKTETDSLSRGKPKDSAEKAELRLEPSCSFLTGYSNWDYKTVTFPDIAKRTHIEISAPAEHLLPCCIHLSKDKYTFDVQTMKNKKQIDNTDEQLEFSFGQAGWKASIKLRMFCIN